MIFQYYEEIMDDFSLNGWALSGVNEHHLARLIKPAICSGILCDWDEYDNATDRYGFEGWGTNLGDLGQLYEEAGLQTEYHRAEADEVFGEVSAGRFAELKDALRIGRPVIVHVYRHYMVATGYSDSKQEIYFNNPQGRRETISYATFQRGVGVDDEDQKSWDGRMLIIKPQIYRVHLKMKANYDDSDSSGTGLYFYSTDSHGNRIGAKRNMNLFRSYADDGAWHTFYWRLTDDVAPLRSGRSNPVT